MANAKFIKRPGEPIEAWVYGHSSEAVCNGRNEHKDCCAGFVNPHVHKNGDRSTGDYIYIRIGDWIIRDGDTFTAMSPSDFATTYMPERGGINAT